MDDYKLQNEAEHDTEIDKLKNEIANLKHAIELAHGLIVPLKDQIIPSVLSIREALYVLSRAL